MNDAGHASALVRLPPRLLVIAAVAFGAVLLGRAWQLAPPQINDSILHERLAAYAAMHWDAHWPVDFWFPEVTAGFPMFAHYPHLSHLAAAAMAHAAGSPEHGGRVYETLRLLLTALMPLSIFVSLRRMRLDDWTAALTAVFYTVLASRGNFGIDWSAAVWRGGGLGPQVWGTFLLFPALAWGYSAVRHGRSVLAAGGLLALCALAHFLYGYMAALSLALLVVLPDGDVAWRVRLRRLAAVAAVAGAASAYFVVPFVLTRDVLLHSRWEPQWKWDSHGWGWLLEHLGQGRIFDAATPPVLSVLVALGFVIAVARARRDGAARWIAACFLLWIVLLAGRAGLGGLVDLLPLSGGLHMHRFIGGVQAFGLMLAGVAGATGIRGISRRLPRWPAIALSVIALAALLAIPVREQLAFMHADLAWGAIQKAITSADRDLDEIITVLRQQPPGRVHAGFHGTWGKAFTVAYAPLYSVLQAQGFDMVGYLFMAMARPGEWQGRLDYRRPEHADLFNVRYLVAPAALVPPPFVRRLAARGRYVLYEVPTSGYFSTARVEPLPPDALGGAPLRNASWDDVYHLGDAWLQGAGPLERRFLGADGSVAPVLPSAPSGAVRDARIAANVYEATVSTPETTDVVLKVTAHPWWRAEVDGVPVATREVLPGFMAVRVAAGEHVVRFTYAPPWWKRLLFGVAVIVLAAALIALVRDALEPSAPHAR